MWTDIRNGHKQIYAQRLNVRGEVEWDINGIAVDASSKSQVAPFVVTDDAGGAIIVWTDQSEPPAPTSMQPTDIYAQRINAHGKTMWTTGGVVVCAMPNDQIATDVIPDGKGGAFITWKDGRTGTPRIYIQQLNAGGTASWSQNGVQVCPGTTGDWPTLLLTDNGNVIVTWSDHRSNGSVYTQMMNTSGIPQWTTDGVLVCDAEKNQYFTSIISDGEQGAIISWLDKRKNERVEIYAQRLNSKGEKLWVNEGLHVATKVSQQRKPPMIADGNGGAIFAWDDHRNGDNIIDVYAQRVNASGHIMWNPGGLPICTKPNRQHWSTPVTDGAGGAIIIWEDNGRDEALYGNIYAQRINAAGNTLWTSDGVAVAVSERDKIWPVVAPGKHGGAVVAWTQITDETNISPASIYAEFINPNGITGCITSQITQQPVLNQITVRDGIAENLVVTATGFNINYQWFSNSIASLAGATPLSSGSTTNTYIPATSVTGTFYYFCVITGNCDTLYSDIAEIVVQNPVTIPTEPGDGYFEIIVNPNPASPEFNIVIKSPGAQALELRVLDMSGRTMAYRQGWPGEVFRLGENFAAGMYIIEARQAGRKAVKKAIKR